MSSELFQIHCPSCGSRLNAKTSLIGQTRNCPKCKTPIVIRLPDAEPVIPASEVGTTAIIVPQVSITVAPTGPMLGGSHAPVENLPTRLEFRNRYLILNPDRIIAVWETGKGWQMNVGSGFAPAKKNIAAIPDQGTFALVELVIGTPAAGSLAAGGPCDLHVFQISQRGALTSLYRDDNEVLGKVDGPATLNNVQKSALSGYIRQHFMAEGLDGAGAVFDYLSMS